MDKLLDSAITSASKDFQEDSQNKVSMDSIDDTSQYDTHKCGSRKFNFDEVYKNAIQFVKPNSDQMYMESGVIYQRVGKYKVHRHSKNFSTISVAINHKPHSKYTNKKLRELREKHGVGSKRVY